MVEYPLTRSRQKQLDALRERWPDMNITGHWFGFLAVPKGTEPVVVATYADTVSEQLERFHDATGAEPGTPLADTLDEPSNSGYRHWTLPIDLG